MRVVAGDAAEPASTRAEAAARVHLLDLADERDPRPGPTAGSKTDQNSMEAAARADSPRSRRSSSHNAPIAVQVALLADRLPERGLQVRGVDDRHVPAVDALRDVPTCSSPGPWHRSQPIAWPLKIGG